MARFPVLSAAGQAVPASIFAKLRDHLARFRAMRDGDSRWSRDDCILAGWA